MNLICLMNSAFSFFQNYPCRLAHIEIDCDLPCEEFIFNSAHPFAEANFHFTRNLTVSEAFQSLFEEHPEDRSRSSSHFSSPKHNGNPLGFTVFDMFILIHRMYPLSPLKCRHHSLTPGWTSRVLFHQLPHDPSRTHSTESPECTTNAGQHTWIRSFSDPR